MKMRPEFENIKSALEKAAKCSKIYHERISEARRTCRAEFLESKVNEVAKPLKEAMDAAMAEVAVQIDDLEKVIRKRSVMDPKVYAANKDLVDMINLLKPDGNELEQIAEQFDGNETMLRVFRKYCEENKIGANLPMCGNDKLRMINAMRQDLNYLLACAGAPTSGENRYGDEILQHWSANFEAVLADKISAVGAD